LDTKLLNLLDKLLLLLLEAMNVHSINNILTKGVWYHTVEYNNIKSKGTFDYTKIIDGLNFPRMDDLNVLDVGCSDGFFSMYFLRNLNAKKVTGVDINKYDGSVAFEVLDTYKDNYIEKYDERNDFNYLVDDYEKLELNDPNKFNFLKKIYNLNMEFISGSIYELENIKNHDVTFCGSLLEHLRDPVSAIENLYFKTNRFCIIDVSNTIKNNYVNLFRPYLKYTNSGGNFFHYSEKAIKLMMRNVGFENVKTLKRYKIKIEKYGYKIPHSILIGYKN